MRFSDSNTIAALEQAPIAGLIPRSLVWISVRDPENDERVGFGFWSEPLPLEMDVISGEDGSTVERTYAGDGALVSVSPIRLSASIRVRQASFVLNPLHPGVAQAMRQYDAFRAPVEIHRALLSTTSRLLVAPPRPRFVGYIDGAPIDTPAIGGQSRIAVECISATAELTRTNPAKRSDETQKLRSGDRHMRYADVCHQWEVPWGEKDTRPAKDRNHGRGQSDGD